VLLPETSITGAFDLAENIRHSVHALRADQQGRADSTPTISIGVASMTPRPGLYPKDLIKAADAALYEAKHGTVQKRLIFHSSRNHAPEPPLAHYHWPIRQLVPERVGSPPPNSRRDPQELPGGTIHSRSCSRGRLSSPRHARYSGPGRAI
jgi:hypothetical protein